jgi:uncharacterized protein YndB with AHSA1/START domain
MTSLISSSADDYADREIVSTRVIAAPRTLVFKAWTDPDRLARWWGPKGFTNTFKGFDLRPGGHWDFVMHGPDGKNYENQCVFIEIAAPRRLVFQHVSGPRFLVTATFEEVNGGTRVVFRMGFESRATLEALKAVIIPANEENFDRLEAELARMAGQGEAG